MGHAHLAPDHLRVAIERLGAASIAANQGHHLDTGTRKQKGPQETEARESLSVVGAEAGTRTPMSIRSLRPERSASTNSATSASAVRMRCGDYF